MGGGVVWRTCDVAVPRHRPLEASRCGEEGGATPLPVSPLPLPPSIYFHYPPLPSFMSSHRPPLVSLAMSPCRRFARYPRPPSFLPTSSCHSRRTVPLIIPAHAATSGRWGVEFGPGAAPPRHLRVRVQGSAYLPIPDNSLVSGCAGARIFPHSRSCQSLTTPWSERCGRFRHPRSPTPSQRLKLTSSQVTLPSGVCTHACLARPSCTARCTVGLMLRRGHAPVGCA